MSCSTDLSYCNTFGSIVIYNIKRMFGAIKDKTSIIKYFLNNEIEEVEENYNKCTYPTLGTKKTKILFNKSNKFIPSDEETSNNKIQDSQNKIFDKGTGDNGSRNEIVSVFVKTSRKLQEVVRGYEAKVNQTTTHITCLQDHIYNLHDQLAHKNKMIGRVCDRYVALCKEKQASEEHLQKKIDELSAVVDACLKKDTPQLQRLLLQQISRNRYLEYQNETLSQKITDLCMQKAS